MAVAELFIGALITVLFEKLASGDLIRLALSAGIYSELNKWSDTLTQIQAVLVDAGQKHIKDTSVQLWLNKLQHLAYEIDDVLDDLATEAMHRLLNQESDASTNNRTSKVLKSIPNKFHAFKYGHKMSSKLDGITAKLRGLVDEKNLLGLIDNVERAYRPIFTRLEETSLVDESKIIGRVGDKDALLGKLLESESSSIQTQNVNVVSIVGLGGIGKTTLAQLLYNDEKVKGHFELLAWVCISGVFDVFNISKAIFQAASGGNQDFANLNLLQVALSDKLSKKRFLLVLDDVWNEDYNKWELLQRPFNAGAYGSKIIVTTRSFKVASVMDSILTYSLELLTDEEALSLFARHASGKQNFDVNQTLKICGEDIVKKCGRLPLALKTVGRVFRTKSNYEEWEELLNSGIWNSLNESKTLPALRLSYYDLPPFLKQMFAYCCLFPKDYMFDKDELVLLWMAEGFLHESNENKSMESIGHNCFEELVSRSFFQHSANDKSRYIMHDLINDLAMDVAKEFFLRLDDKNESLEKFHHISFICERFMPYKKFKSLQCARRLRSFLGMPLTKLELDSREIFFLSNLVLVKLLPQLQCLRVLSLAYFSINEVPQSISSLKHLRYLNFSNTNITSLPEQIGNLHNLQSLLLSSCGELSTLPNSITNLINLRHLDITNTPKLNKMPLGIGGLTGLQTLSRVIIGGSGEFRICDLKGFLHLRGQLSIEGLHEVKDALQAKESKLQQKKGIYHLQMKWIDFFDDSRNEITEYKVLEELRPFEKLRSLEILYYSGKTFPSWVGHPSFDCITQLKLIGCRNCTCLPTLGCLPSLQNLSFESIHKLKKVGCELVGPTNTFYGSAFPSLEVLELKNMYDWEEWSTLGFEKDGMFPCLLKLSIINCPKLDVIEIGLIPSLQVLHVEQCSIVVFKSMLALSSVIARLKMCNIRGLTQLHGETLKQLGAVKELEISSCHELTYLWESEARACKILMSLQKLKVSECENLVSIGVKMVNQVISMRSFREVIIKNCPRFKSYNCPDSIETLDLTDCPSVTSLTFPTVHDLSSTLKSLTIKKFDITEVSWLLNNFLASLTFLFLFNCDNLKFPEGCLVHLTTLIIDDCNSIESIPDKGYGFLPSCCLKQLVIINCKNLKSLPCQHLQRLRSLEDVVIMGCPSLIDSFPCGLWPPNLSSLEIGDLKKPISKWGMQNFPTSLVKLNLFGENSGVVSFAKAEEDTSSSSSSSSFLLPSSLTFLHLADFKELESLSKGLQHLTCLQILSVRGCTKLRDLPETLLPSLSSLRVVSCTKLRKKCCRKGKYSPCHLSNSIPQILRTLIAC